MSFHNSIVRLLGIAFLAMGATWQPTPARAQAPADDPLLRSGQWLASERARVQGTVARMARELESPLDRYAVTDDNGRRFEIDQRGELRFDPLYSGSDALQPGQSNWKPIVARTDDAPLYYAEALALDERGLRTEAFYLMKGLRAMAYWSARDAGLTDASSDRPVLDSAAVRRTAEQATAWLNQIQRKLSSREFDRPDRLSDPFAVYDSTRDRTLVFSHRFAWRATFPGEWRFQRGLDRDSQSTTDTWGSLTRGERATVYLQRGNWQAMLATDVPPDGRPLPGLPALRREWDLRRTLTGQRKRVLQYVREPIALAREFAEEGQRPDGVAAYRASLNDRRFRYEFYEAYAIGRSPASRALCLQLSRMTAIGTEASAPESSVEFQLDEDVFRRIATGLAGRGP